MSLATEQRIQYRCYVDGSTTCMDARRSLRKAPFQYSCEACVHEGGPCFYHSELCFHILERSSIKKQSGPECGKRRHSRWKTQIYKREEETGGGEGTRDKEIQDAVLLPGAAEAPNSETSLLITLPNLLTLLVLVLFPSFCICCLCAWLVRRRRRRKERISDSRKLNQAGHIEPTREEIWTSSSSSVRKNSNSIKEEADYGGYTDYEEPTPPAPALENLSRESTGKSIYENMHSWLFNDVNAEHYDLRKYIGKFK